MNLVKIISAELDSLKSRVVKFLRLGLNDVQTSVQINPYGVDANPIADMIALYSPTEEKGKTVIIGYINVNQIAAPGEHRIFSTDADGNVVMALHLKNDGTAEFGGNNDFMVRYSALETAFNELKADHNSLASKWSTFAAAYVAGGPSVQGLPPTASSEAASTADISGAKIDEIKTLS